MQQRNVKCILERFDDHTHEKEDRFVHATEWINGEGVDIHFKDDQMISLSWSQYLALRRIVNNEFLNR